MIQVSIVARIPLIREGLRALLAAEEDLQVTTLAPSESSPLLESVLAAQPEVVLIDVEVLEREGWAFLRELQTVAPGIAPLVIGDTPDDRRIANALILGARGYLLREAAPEEMASAIRAAQQGLYVLHPAAATTLFSQQPTPNPAFTDEEPEYDAPDPRAQTLIEPLSPRELDVLRLIARGLPNKQIAAQLYITEHTVKYHIRAILGKLGASNRTEAVTLALQKGLVTL